MQKRFYPCDKKMILKHSLSNTNTYVWSKKRVWIRPSIFEVPKKIIFSFITNMYFLQS